MLESQLDCDIVELPAVGLALSLATDGQIDTIADFFLGYSSDRQPLHTRPHDCSAIDVYIRAMVTIEYSSGSAA
jgi:hypothetical protein